jgi:hypothetical protein
MMPTTMPTTQHLAAVLLFALAVTVGGALDAQRISDPRALHDRLDDLLAGDWLRNAQWITDFDAAKAMAAKRGRHIFAYFTRSYAP